MCANLRSHLHAFLRRSFPLAAFAVISCGWAATQDDPMALPPRTSQPPASAQQESSQPQPTDQKSGEPSISPIQSSEDQGRFVFRKQVQEVVLHATVVDDYGRLVTGLDRNAFSVYQNGLPEAITSFRREDVPVAIGIVIDNSGSMRDKRARVNQAVVNLIRASNSEDEVFVVNFNDRVTLASIPDDLERAILNSGWDIGINSSFFLMLGNGADPRSAGKIVSCPYAICVAKVSEIVGRAGRQGDDAACLPAADYLVK